MRPDAYIDRTDHSFRDGFLSEPQRREILESPDRNYIEQRILEIFYNTEFYQKESNNEELRE